MARCRVSTKLAARFLYLPPPNRLLSDNDVWFYSAGFCNSPDAWAQPGLRMRSSNDQMLLLAVSEQMRNHTVNHRSCPAMSKARKLLQHLGSPPSMPTASSPHSPSVSQRIVQKEVKVLQEMATENRTWGYTRIQGDGAIKCRKRMGGLLRYYYREAA